MMQAVCFKEFGEPADVLQLTEVPPPIPQAGEVCIRMLSTPVNPSDLMTVRGVYGKRPVLPATPGYEGVGIVTSSGGGLMGAWLAGRRVAVLNPAGGNWSEQVVIPARQALPLPKELSQVQAAMFFVNPATAYVMTQEVLKIPRGAWLIQSAAGSALGQMIIKLGHVMGFHTLNLVRSETQAEELKQLGGDEVFVFSADQPEASQAALQERVNQLTAGAGLPFAIDPVGGSVGSAMVSLLGHGGRLLLFGTLANEPLSFSSRLLMTAHATVEGFWLSQFMQKISLFKKLSIIRKISQLQRQGILTAEVAETFPLKEIKQAVVAAERPQRRGKIILQISEK